MEPDFRLDSKPRSALPEMPVAGCRSRTAQGAQLAGAAGRTVNGCTAGARPPGPGVLHAAAESVSKEKSKRHEENAL